jgi:hypothetical protein
LSKLSFCDQANSDRKIFIDTSELDVDATVRLRQEDVSDSGMLKKRYSLASEPFVVTSKLDEQTRKENEKKSCDIEKIKDKRPPFPRSFSVFLIFPKSLRDCIN